MDEVKITRLDIAKSYNAGSMVSAKIVVVNSGSTIVTGFEIRTLAVNNNYAFMGDKAKKEYIDQYSTDLKPGVSYDIPIGFTIPEKVSGIRPSGKYTITVSLVLNGKVVDKKLLTQKSNNYLPGRSVYLWLTPVSDIHCSTIAMSFGRILAFVDLAAMMMRVFPGADRTSMPP